MTITRSTTLIAVAAALCLASLAAPAVAQAVSEPIALHGAGSTFASLLYRKWIETYRQSYPGAIKRWDDTRIRDANPGVTFPRLDIVLVARQDASGTTSVFTQHLATVKPTWRELGLGVGKLVQWPANTMLASGSEGIVARIKMAQGAIGYVEYGFPKRLGLPMAALQNKSGKFVSPDPRSGQLALTGGAPPLKELDASVIDPVGAAAYPIVSYSWIAINQKYSEPAKGAAIREFIDWGLSHGQEQGVDLGYVPLAAGVIQMSKHALGAPGL